GDNRDTYIEALCNRDDDSVGYKFNGFCTPFETHIETIKVKDASDVTCTVRRTEHGPVTVPACNQPWPTPPGQVFSQKTVVRGREIESMRALLALNRAKNLQDFTAAVRQMEIAFNFIYADATGNIAYFLSGKVPIRPDTCSAGDPATSCVDPRLPFP